MGLSGADILQLGSKIVAKFIAMGLVWKVGSPAPGLIEHFWFLNGLVWG